MESGKYSWLDMPETHYSRQTLKEKLARDTASFVVGCILMFGVGFVGYHLGQQAERIILYKSGLCRLPPEVTKARVIGFYPNEGRVSPLRVERL